MLELKVRKKWSGKFGKGEAGIGKFGKRKADLHLRDDKSGADVVSSSTPESSEARFCWMWKIDLSS